MNRSWMDDAECVGVYPGVFFPVGAEDVDPVRRAAAYAPASGYCWTCPVRVDCLEAALAEEGAARTSLRHGMRGGMTPKQRQAIAARRAGTAQAVHLAAQLEEAS